MPPRTCTSCDTPHVTIDWYVIDERGHRKRGQVECREAHEKRIAREVRLDPADKRPEGVEF